MAERGLTVDHVTIWRWVQCYAPVLNHRIRREIRRPNRSWRVDETYVKVAGSWAYLYRAVDSAGETIEFMLVQVRLDRGEDVPTARVIARRTRASRDQRRRASGIRECSRRTEADR